MNRTNMTMSQLRYLCTDEIENCNFLLLVRTRIYCALNSLNERKKYSYLPWDESLWLPAISLHAWPEMNNHRENLNDCHYCPTNYSTNIIQPLFMVGTKGKNIRVANLTNDTPLFTKYTIVHQKCFRSRWPQNDIRLLWSDIYPNTKSKHRGTLVRSKIIQGHNKTVWIIFIAISWLKLLEIISILETF